MDTSHFNQELLAYLEASPTPFQAVSEMAKVLLDNGFVELSEKDAWDTTPGKYFVTRNGSSIIAFTRGTSDPIETGVRMVGAHTDSPNLRVKPNPEQRGKGYLSLGVEVYGGVLLNPWFDRDLSIAGRVTYTNEAGELQHSLIDFKRPIAVIPSLAIHLDREVNSSRSINPQRDIPPVMMLDDTSVSFDDLLKQELKTASDITASKVESYEMSFYDVNSPALIGLKSEFIASARLDNLLSCFIGLKAILSADTSLTNILVCNDHEEVGSTSAEGAQGPFLEHVLERLIPEGESRQRAIANSMLISTDNAHGIHPNFPDKHDPNHGPLLNAGPVIKINTNQRYATNSATGGYFSRLCDTLDVPCQKFVVRTDMACGSTIGPLTAKEIGVKTLDVGVPTFGMHSIRELAGSEDGHYLYRVLCAFYSDAAV